MPRVSPVHVAAESENCCAVVPRDIDNETYKLAEHAGRDINSFLSCRLGLNIGFGRMKDSVKTDSIHRSPGVCSSKTFPSKKTAGEVDHWDSVASTFSGSCISALDATFQFKDDDLKEHDSLESPLQGSDRSEGDPVVNCSVAHDAANYCRPTNDVFLTTGESGPRCSGVEIKSASKRFRIDELEVRSPSTEPLRKSSQFSVDCDEIWSSGGNDLRNVVTVAQTTIKMPSYNLKSQSQTSANSKEAGASAGGAARTVFQCHACQKEFVTEKYLCMHMALHRTQSSTSIPSTTLSVSAAGAKQANSKIHISGLSDESVKLVKSDGTGTSHWTCKICSKTFAQSSNYKNHIRTHSDERPFICNVCSIGFKERYHLKKHILFKHSDELKEECRVCGKRFKDSTAVRAHERIHSEERPYGCQRCDKTFKTSECLWHHENRSRTCGKSLKGGIDGDLPALQTAPRFRRGRHPGKRTVLGKVKTGADAEDNSIGEVSACLSLDHVEEIPASVKIELESELPEYYFKTVPAICNYDFDYIDNLSLNGSLNLDKGVMMFQSNPPPPLSSTEILSKVSHSEVKAHKSPSGVVTTLPKHAVHTATPYWPNEWTSSATGVFLESPSRPLSATYDFLAETYRSGTPEKSWKQDLPNPRQHSGMYVSETVGSDFTSNTVKGTLSQYTLPHGSHSMQLAGSSGGATSASGSLPFGGLVPLNIAKSENQQHSGHTQVQHVRRPFSEDFSTTDETSRSLMALTSMAHPVMWSSKPAEPAPHATAPDRSSEISATTAASYAISFPNVPTAVVAPFKRESSSRHPEVSHSELDQPVKNSLPPFETFAPMTRRVQKSHQPMPKAIPCPSPVAAPYANFATLYSPDGSVADQCPTIQKYLLRGHPNASIKPNRSLTGEMSHRGVPYSRQCYAVSPRDGRKRVEVSPNQVPLEVNHLIAGRQELPDFLGFLTDGELKLGDEKRDLIANTDANCSVNFVKMAPAVYAQSTTVQPLCEINDSNTMPVNLYQQI